MTKKNVLTLLKVCLNKPYRKKKKKSKPSTRAGEDAERAKV
jgi:hypothetical protein